ncbi:MAG: hypothetical protein WBB82_09175 [Limnothrix sp.]
MNQAGQMTWSPDGGLSEGVLHFRLKPFDPWRPYTEFPEYSKPDLPIGSEGYSTFVALIRQNWEYVRS